MGAQESPDDLVQMNVRVRRSTRDAIDARRAKVHNPRTGQLGISRDRWVENAAKFALAQKTTTTSNGKRTVRS